MAEYNNAVPATTSDSGDYQVVLKIARFLVQTSQCKGIWPEQVLGLFSAPPDAVLQDLDCATAEFQDFKEATVKQLQALKQQHQQELQTVCSELGGQLSQIKQMVLSMAAKQGAAAANPQPTVQQPSSISSKHTPASIGARSLNHGNVARMPPLLRQACLEVMPTQMTRWMSGIWPQLVFTVEEREDGCLCCIILDLLLKEKIMWDFGNCHRGSGVVAAKCML